MESLPFAIRLLKWAADRKIASVSFMLEVIERLRLSDEPRNDEQSALIAELESLLSGLNESCRTTLRADVDWLVDRRAQGLWLFDIVAQSDVIPGEVINQIAVWHPDFLTSREQRHVSMSRKLSRYVN